MSDEPSVLPAIAATLSHTPATVTTPFFKAIGSLLGGLTAIPAGWARRPAQAIEDKTAARSTVTTLLAQAVAQDAIADPVVMRAAAEMYLPTELRKARNKILIAQSAAEHIGSAEADTASAAPPDDDWLNTFMRYAEDASSERLQDLFGRILAGQVVRPGSFATSTLRAVSELDQGIATDFSHVWNLSVGTTVDFSAEFHIGDGYARWKRLAEAGLMSIEKTGQYTPPFVEFQEGLALWCPMATPEAFLLVSFREHCGARWDHIAFTRAGREIGSLLPAPDYAANMRAAARIFFGDGTPRVDLHRPGHAPEQLWVAPAVGLVA